MFWRGNELQTRQKYKLSRSQTRSRIFQFAISDIAFWSIGYKSLRRNCLLNLHSQSPWKWTSHLKKDAQKVARFWPHKQKTGGFFIAKLKKLSSLPYTPQYDKRKKEKIWLNDSFELQSQVWNYLLENRGIEKQNNISFLASENSIYLTTPEYSQLPSGLFVEKIGVPILKIWNQGGWIPQQGLARILGQYANKNTVKLSDEQAEQLNQKLDLSGYFGEEGSFLILKWRDFGFCLGKQVWDTLKNKLF